MRDDDREPAYLLDALLLLALYGGLLWLFALTGCCRAPIAPDPLPVIVRECLVEAPPAPAEWSVVRDGCAAGLVCLRGPDARALAYEVEARREWDARAWARCGHREPDADAENPQSWGQRRTRRLFARVTPAR